MWFDGVRQPDTIYVVNTSRGKDSTAMLRAIQIMGWPIDMIVSVDVWFDDDTPAELPPMVEFKDEYDRKVEEKFGIPVTRLCATKRSQNGNAERERERELHTVTFFDPASKEANSSEQSKDSPCNTDRGAKNSNKLTYVDIFYREVKPRKLKSSRTMRINGFPIVGGWCNSALKKASLRDSRILDAAGVRENSNTHIEKPRNEGRKINIVHYIGIAADEPKRIQNHIDKPDMIMPLVQIGWDESLCGLEATYMDMLAPTYTDTHLRDGCWFCHNQSVSSLRDLRHDYPNLWAKLLRLDLDSPVTFHPDGHTLRDFEERFQMEDDGFIDPNERFRWEMLKFTQIKMF